MSHEATVTSRGQITIPKDVRDQMGLEEGETVLFRFDADGSVRLVRVPSDPQERLEAARKRGSSLELDAAELLDAERDEWS
ncbi:AbrB/MazE/SpoVT family DNA-binding domain-containing protein [Natronolimnobius sp. AArcel1]|uniref:AbrB/MazE/SpoVT family DNA-binding domain-containing protein n=1 Tax=Natronolimnobius sp. AArcel1 TaxID=1679093 RepID=UPI0013EA50FF|nr:AbrB/MazE/SpoVT family DNA-binding domain-containing protein [Natronolimnobius sp. AArcel1]NGM68792.1 AbrB/MazE/SpoVT family DNA-binding domain-containing protein [Natronolimnobius sp. AArcel1]